MIDAKSLGAWHTGAESHLGDRVLGDAEKNNYCFARRMGILQAHSLKTVCPDLKGVVGTLVQGERASLWMFFD